MDLVRKLIASSISLGDFRLTLRFILFFRDNLKVSQSIRPWVREGYCGLFGGVESIVRSTVEWSKLRSS